MRFSVASVSLTQHHISQGCDAPRVRGMQLLLVAHRITRAAPPRRRVEADAADRTKKFALLQRSVGGSRQGREAGVMRDVIPGGCFHCGPDASQHKHVMRARDEACQLGWQIEHMKEGVGLGHAWQSEGVPGR